MSPADEALREQVRRAILDRDNPYLSEQISEAQADVAADAVLPLLTAERERADRLTRAVEALCDKDPRATGYVLVSDLRAALSAAETGSE